MTTWTNRRNVHLYSEGAAQHALLIDGGLIAATVLLVGLTALYASLVRSGDAGAVRSDFVAYFAGAHVILAGHASQLYDFHALGHTEAALVRPLRVRDGVLPFVYPAFFAVALVPLAHLSLSAAFTVWTLANLILFAIVLALLAREANLRSREFALFCALALSFLPVLISLAQGQTSTLLVSALATFWLLLRRDRQYLAGAVLTLVLIKPPYALLFVLVALLRGQWRVGAAFTLSGLVLFCAPAFAFGPPVMTGYVHTLQAATGWTTQYGYGAQWNQSIAGAIHLLVSGPPALMLAVAADALLCCVVAAVAWCSRSIDGPIALAAVATVLVSPHVLIHDVSLAVLAFAIAVHQGLAASRLFTPLTAMTYLLCTAGPMLVDYIPVQAPVVAMLLLFVWLARGLLKPRPALLPIPGVA